MCPVAENLGEKCLVSARLVGGGRVPGAAASAMEAVAMSPSSVSSHNLDAASTSDDMPSSQEGLLFSDSLKVRLCASHLDRPPRRNLCFPSHGSRRCSCGNQAAFLDCAAGLPEKSGGGSNFRAALDCGPLCPCQSQDFVPILVEIEK